MAWTILSRIFVGRLVTRADHVSPAARRLESWGPRHRSKASYVARCNSTHHREVRSLLALDDVDLGVVAAGAQCAGAVPKKMNRRQEAGLKRHESHRRNWNFRGSSSVCKHSVQPSVPRTWNDAMADQCLFTPNTEPCWPRALHEPLRGSVATPAGATSRRSA